MKPFFFLLLLITFGVLCAVISRPVEQFAAAARTLGRKTDRFVTKRAIASAALRTTGRGTRQRASAGDSWRPASQF